jgi:hypothetical protein
VFVRHIANKIPANRRASATMATRLPRRAAVRSAHALSAASAGAFERRIPLPEPQPLAAHCRLDQRDVAGPRPDDGVADGEFGADVPLRVGHAMDRAVGAKPTGLTQRSRVALVGLQPSRARGLHRREAGIGHDDLVA